MSKVFISYRREDSFSYARTTYRELVHHISKNRVFMDVDTVAPGADFVDVIQKAVAESDVLVAFIGKNWAGVDRNGKSRLNNPNDFVRLEISAALERNIRVIPVLVDGMTMPSQDTLPTSLKTLTRRNAMEISHTRFDYDVERLVTAVLRNLGDAVDKRSRLRTYGQIAAAVAVVVVIFSFLFWWPKAEVAPIKKAEVHEEPIKEPPLVKPQPPPKETVTSAPEKRLEAQPPVVKVQPETRSEITSQKKAEGQREIPSQTREREPKQEKLAIQTGRTGESPSNAQVSALRTRGQIAGRWEGRYQCQGDEIGFSLDITNEDGNHVAAIFEFFPLPETVSFPRGSFRMVGDYNRNDGNLHLQSTAWIQRPLGFQSHNLEGQIEASGTTISGRVLTAGCADFMLTRK